MTAYNIFDPTSLFSGDKPYPHRPILVAEAAAPLERGTLLGPAPVTAAGSVTVAAGAENVGNGVITPDAATPVIAGAKPGAYLIEMTAATTFSVYDPKGALVGTGSTAAAFDTQIKFTLTAGGVAMVAGDYVLYEVGAQFVVSKAGASDGSQIPTCVLAADMDTTAGAVKGPAYFEGGFVFERMTVDASWTLDSLETALRANNIPIFPRPAGALG